ncbi:MAG: hypothetical protein G8345_06935 [Magnetococcales bacterium]|nr:hypothetical protein [Magnetococcales bacterium]NGZ26607.1 hypothetical protein [Magnetococcales bacterium]
MELLHKLERQHEKLVTLSQDLESALAASEENKKSLADSHKIFSQLLKKTRKHLGQVDQILYPQILLIHNRKLRRNLGRILTRTGHVRTEVGFLLQSWTLKNARKRPSVFQSVGWHFLTILNMRLTGERKIYAILNRCTIPIPPSVELAAPGSCPPSDP